MQRSTETGEFRDPLQNYEPKQYADALEQALAEESVAAIQHRPAATIGADTPVCEAVQKLAQLQVACLLIEDDGQLVGVFTDRDVLEKVALEGKEVQMQPVRSVMTPDPIFVYESDSAAAALAVMAVSGFRHVPVTDLQKQVVGIVSPQRVTEFLRKYGGPHLTPKTA